MFTLRQILQKCRERQIPTHLLFIDFKAAYDTIDKKELLNIMQLYHFPDPAVRGHHERGAVQGESILTSESFESHRGLRQGDGLSCLLFNIALEGVIRGTRLNHDIRGTILYRYLQFICLADDIDIIGRTTAKVYTCKNWIENQCVEDEVPACR